jgi:precorrin-2 dehydrogenase/sirohydrochlorin ferrochelatase
MYPLFLKMDGRLSVVIGGGHVGRRKAAGLLQANGRVRLVCLEPRPADEIAPSLEWLTEEYHVRHLLHANLVFAAATPDVNRIVVADARARGLWVCSATEPDTGDFHTTSVIRRGDLTLALGTGGAAPALTRALRQKFETMLDEEMGEWLALLAALRPLIQEKVSDPERRRQLWDELCGEHWMERFQREGNDVVQAAIVRLVEEVSK